MCDENYFKNKSTGWLNYHTNYLVLECDQGIIKFYRNLIPKYLYVAPPKFPAHITIVSHETPPNKDKVWNKYQGEVIEFSYSSQIINDELYYWLDVHCKRLEEIRVELGLDPIPYWHNKFHMTVGNVKEQ